jgi:hypothetical protein
MRTATGLALIAIGAILAFAVTQSPSFLNLQIVGWVLMLTGVAGMVVPRRGYGWLRRRVVVRRPRGGTTVLEPENERRELGPSRLFPDPRLPVAETTTERTVERTVPGTGQPAEETVEEYFEE